MAEKLQMQHITFIIKSINCNLSVFVTLWLKYFRKPKGRKDYAG